MSSSLCTSESIPQGPTPSTVLVVDDTPTNVIVLTKILERAGIDFVVAYDGIEALETLEQLRPDLILLDVMMPRMDGLEVCRIIKSTAAHADTPVIFLSAMIDIERKLEAFELGASDYITKPFDTAEVLARVRTQLKLGELRRSLKIANMELTARQNLLDAELRAASGIQRSLLPPEQLDIDGLRVDWRFEPCHTLGGDIFNAFRTSEQRAVLYIVDVSGHGVPSALVSVSLAQRLNPTSEQARKDRNGLPGRPALVLEQLDREYPQDRFDKHLTICYATMNLESGELTYSSGGHPGPILVRAGGALEILSRGGPAIGLGPVVPWEEETVKLNRGDRLYLYTDGITEATSPSGEMFGIDRFWEFLDRCRSEPLERVGDLLLEEIAHHRGGAVSNDDVSFLVAERQ